MVQLSHPYMTIGKTIALTIRTFVGKVMSLYFNMLFRLVITFLPMSKCLLISWLQSPSAVILEHSKMHETSCQSRFDTGCLGLVHWDNPEGGYGEGGGRRFRMGNTGIPVADSFLYLAKLIKYCEV